METSNNQKEQDTQQAQCTATVSTPFLIFIVLAAVVGAVLYFVLK